MSSNTPRNMNEAIRSMSIGARNRTAEEQESRALPGGTLRYRIGEQEPEPTFQDGPSHHEPTVRVAEGASRAVVTRDGSPAITKSGSAAYSPAHDVNELKGIFQTAQNPLTGKVIQDYSEVKDTTLLRVGDVEMTAEMAAKVGLVRRDERGYRPLDDINPRDVDRNAVIDTQTGEQGEGQEQQQESDVIDHLSPEVRRVLDKVDELTGSPNATEAVINQALPHILDGDIDKASQALAHRIGIEPEHAAEAVQFVFDSTYKTAADRISRDFGVDGTEVFQYLGAKLPKAERQSLAYRLYLGDASAFQEAVDRYNRGQLVAQHSNK